LRGQKATLWRSKLDVTAFMRRAGVLGGRAVVADGLGRRPRDPACWSALAGA